VDGASPTAPALQRRLADDPFRFSDRPHAGRELAALLAPQARERPVVVGIPRGGVPVAAQIARALHAPLDVAVVCKIGSPHNPEFAIGALAERGVLVIDRRLARAGGLDGDALRALVARMTQRVNERVDRYRGERQAVGVAGRPVILVDDGLATGRSAQAAAILLRRRGAARVTLAMPVAAPASIHALRAHVDGVVCVQRPADLFAVGLWYEDFSPTSDEQVVALLAAAVAPDA
jgi:putative phosphoribosyl transferase